MAGAIEEAGAEIVFKSFNLQRNGRLREQEMLGCLAEAEMLSNGAEHFEAEVFELGQRRMSVEQP